MKDENNHLGELYDLAAAQCEGELTAEQATRLEELVLADANLRSRYIVYMQVHALAERETVADASGEEQTSKANPASHIAPARTRHAGRYTFRIWLAATATALVLVALVSWGIWPWIFPTESVANVQKEIETVPVVVATADIPVGQRILPGDLKIQQWPAEFAPQGAITTLEDATGTDERPHWASSKLVPGDFLSKAKVTPIRDIQVRPGYRAYTIQCSTDGSNGAGVVRAGNFVDVLCARRGTQRTKADVLVEGVKVIAIDQPSNPSRDNENLCSVTLETTLEDAALLAQGQTGGLLTLALRNPSDRPATVNAITFATPGAIVPVPVRSGVPSTREEAAPEEPSREVRILTYRGSKRGQLVIELRIQ